MDVKDVPYDEGLALIEQGSGNPELNSRSFTVHLVNGRAVILTAEGECAIISPK